MKRFFKTIKKMPMLIVFLIIMVFFMPGALFAPGENKERAIVTAVGIDKVDEEYEVSLLTFIPTPNPTYLETSSIVSSVGTSVADALYKAQILTGKRIGLSHAKTTIVGDKMLDEDIAPSMDYLSRIASLSENTIFISTDGTAKDFLKASQSLGKDIGLKLDQLVGFDVKRVYMADSTLEAFYQGYYSPIKTSMIGYLNLVDKEDANITSMDEGESSSEKSGGGGSGSGGGSSSSSSSGSGGGNGGGNAGGSGSSSGGSGGSSGSGSGGSSSGGGQKKIVNNGDVVLLKHGKKAQILSEKTIEGLNIINGRAKGQLIKLKNVTDKEFESADLTYAIRKKNVRSALKIENGIPIYSVDVLLGLELIEINGKQDDLMLNSIFTELTDEVVDRIESYCKDNFAQSLKSLRENRADVLGLSLLMQTSGGEFRKFYNRLEDKEDILNQIVFKLSIKCKSE